MPKRTQRSVKSSIVGLVIDRLEKEAKSKFLTRCLQFVVKSMFSRSFVKVVLSNVDLGRFATVSFDCDLHEDVKAYDEVLSILSRYKIKSSFAVVGKLIELYPQEHRMLVEEGHEIVNHTYTHPHSKFNSKNFFELDRLELHNEISRFDEVCLKVLDYKPVGYRAPHFAHRVDVYDVLRDLGYLYSTSTVASKTKSFGKPYTVRGIVEIPLTPCPKYPFMTFATWGIWRSPKRLYDESEFYDLIQWVVDIGARYNAYLNFYFDPCDVVVMERFEDILKSLKHRGYKIVQYRELLEVIKSESSYNRFGRSHL